MADKTVRQAMTNLRMSGHGSVARLVLRLLGLRIARPRRTLLHGTIQIVEVAMKAATTLLHRRRLLVVISRRGNRIAVQPLLHRGQ